MHITRFPRPLLPPFLFSFFLSQSQKLQVSSAALNVSEGEKGPKKRERSRVGGLESLAPYEGSKRERERAFRRGMRRRRRQHVGRTLWHNGPSHFSFSHIFSFSVSPSLPPSLLPRKRRPIPRKVAPRARNSRLFLHNREESSPFFSILLPLIPPYPAA